MINSYFEINFGIRLNNILILDDIKVDRKSYNAWRRYTVKVRGIDVLSISLFLFLLVCEFTDHQNI